MRGLIAEVGKLERLAQLGTADQRNGFLQIIALLAGDAHFIALNGGLHLELGIFDQFDQLLGHLGFDALLHLHLLGVTTAGVHYVTHIQAAGVDIALEHFIPQDIQHLLELEIGIRGQLDGLLGELVGGLNATEIETGLQFAIGIIHRILHFIDGDFRNDVKRGHGHYLSVQTKAHNLAEKPATLKWSPSAKAVLIKGYFMTPRAYRLLLLLILALMFWRALGPFDIAEKMRAFGFSAERVDGKSEEAISAAVDRAKAVRDSAVCIVLDTIKGQGVPYFENLADNHSVKLSQADDAVIDESVAALTAIYEEAN